MHIVYKSVIWLFCMILFIAGVFFCGYYYGGKGAQSGVIYRNKIITQTIFRDYQGLSRDDCISKLMCYDLRTPALDIQHVEGMQYRLTAELCDREWSRDVKIEAGRSGNWRFYVGGVLIVAGAAVSYRLLH